jgi:hypothetical protein
MGHVALHRAANRTPRRGWPLVCLSALAALSAGAARLQAADVDFTRDVRPILSQHCFKCHGPDDAARQAGLRLDRRAAAVAKTESGAIPIVPGKPAASELVRRIATGDPDEIMPPPAANKPLSDGQKRILREWIAAGAPYERHWAFLPPVRTPRPAGAGSEWSRNAIDDFILARLSAAGLEPSPPADTYTLVRRVYLDLIGLPPTPAEADAFLADPSPDAYERLVDRLLASPHYGERWARRWLDLARYADTNGYEKDRPRSIWPYRDWVIAALNADMPFDRFSIEQLAGDMLPHATLSDRVATGFHRNTMLNEEGGIDPLEFRFYAMVDRVATTGTVWMGLTVGCAQCHTHKFDPIPQTDYYRLLGLLNNADEIEIDLPGDRAAVRARAEQAIAARAAALPDRFPPGGAGGRAAFQRKRDEWIAKESARALHWKTLVPSAAKANLPRLSVLPDGSVLAAGDQSKRDRYELVFDNLPAGTTALRLEVLPHESAGPRPRLLRRSVRRLPAERIDGGRRRSAADVPVGAAVVRRQRAGRRGRDRRQPAHLLVDQRSAGPGERGRVRAGRAAETRRPPVGLDAVRILFRGGTGAISLFGDERGDSRRPSRVPAGGRGCAGGQSAHARTGGAAGVAFRLDGSRAGRRAKRDRCAAQGPPRGADDAGDVRAPSREPAADVPARAGRVLADVAARRAGLAVAV